MTEPRNQNEGSGEEKADVRFTNTSSYSSTERHKANKTEKKEKKSQIDVGIQDER